MAKTVGMTFSIGASLSHTVASAFNTVAGRAKGLKTDLRQLQAVSAAAGKVTATGARVTDLRAQAASGKAVTEQLAAAERAYASARRNAAKYNITVADAAKTHAQATMQIARTDAALQRQEARLRNKAKRSELQGEILGTVASAAIVAAPIKVAINFESSMADAAKTIDGMRDGTGKLTADYYKMEAAVKSMGRELPLTHEELAKLFAAGGQMGMTRVEDLREFTTMSAHMAVAFGMGTEEAADAIGGYKTKLGLTNDQTREMLDLMNQFANTSSATEKDIAGIVGRVGALGDVAGIAYKPMTAMAATLASMKIPEEIAATGLKNFMLALSKGDAATKKQRQAFASLGIDSKKLAIHMQKDAEGAMLVVLQKIKKLPKHMQIATLTELFGSESVGAIAPMLTQLDLLRQNLVDAADTSTYAGAMHKEFENRATTTANALIITRNKASELAITVGNSLLPAVNDILTVAGNGAVGLSAFAAAHPEVVTAVMGAVAALTAYKVASLAGGYALTVVSDAWQVAKGAWAIGTAMCRRGTYAMIYQRTVGTALAVGTRVLTVAQMGLNAAMSNNPIGWVVKAVAALVGGLAYLYNTCEPVRAAFDAIWTGAVGGLKTVWSYVEKVWGGIKSVMEWFAGDDSKEGRVAVEAEKTNPGPSAVVQPPRTAPAVPPLPGPPGMENMPEDFAMPTMSGGMPSRASAALVSLTLHLNLSGVTDADFGKRVLTSLEREKAAIKNLLSGLISDENRLAYD